MGTQIPTVPSPVAPVRSARSRLPVRTLVGLLFLVAATFAPVNLYSQHLFGWLLGPNYGREVLWWVLTFGLYGYVMGVERRRLASIGLSRPKPLDLALGVFAGILLVMGMIVIQIAIFPLLHLRTNMKADQAIMATPFAYRLLLVTRAAVAEETLFRAYPIERLLSWRGSRLLAGALSVAAFTYAHLSYWGPAQLIIVGYGGIVLAVLYISRRNLWANMLAHFIADGAGFLR